MGTINDLKTNFPEVFDNCRYEINSGWFNLVYKLTNMISRLCIKFTVLQVKEKSGKLRFYYHLDDSKNEDIISNLVELTMIKSQYICEKCGIYSFEKLTKYHNNYIIIICEKCYNDNYR